MQKDNISKLEAKIAAFERALNWARTVPETVLSAESVVGQLLSQQPLSFSGLRPPGEVRRELVTVYETLIRICENTIENLKNLSDPPT